MPAVTILNSNLPVAVIDAFVSLDWTRPYWKAGQFALKVSPAVTGVSEIVKGRILLPPDSSICYVIEDILREDDGTSGGEVLTVTGRDLGGFFAERVALPTAGLAYDTQTSVAAETAMKHLVNVNAGPGAASGRQIPSLTVAADAARGGTVTVNARYQYVSDLIEQIGMTGGIGWQVLYNGTGFVFDVIPGVDRHASVFFDALFDTAAAQSWYTSDSGTKTFAYVAGQGVGTARTVVTRPASGVPTGLALRETFIDARDLPDTASLQTRGDGDLAASAVADRFEVTVNPLGSFKYRTDWDLGDLVTIRNQWWSVSKTCRIVDVSLSLDGDSTTPDVKISLDRAFPTFGDAVSQAASSPVATADAVLSTLYAPLSGAAFTGAVSVAGAVTASADFSSPNMVFFRAYKQVTQSFTAGATTQVTYPLVAFNVGSAYSSSTSIFTAPATGTYLLLASLLMNAEAGADLQNLIVVTTADGNVNLFALNLPAGLSQPAGSAILKMTAGDTAKIFWNSGLASSSFAATSQTSFFSIRKIG